MNAQQSLSWPRALTLGVWLSVAAVWPTMTVTVGLGALLWQPLLVGSLLALSWARHHRWGWAAAASQCLFFYILFGLAAWLPALHTTTYGIEYPYPTAYAGYLLLYDAGLAALLSFLALRALRRDTTSWWTRDGWSRPLAVTPLLLLAQGVHAGVWGRLLVGIALGALAAAVPLLRPSANAARAGASRQGRRARRWLIPIGLFLVGTFLAYGAGLRVYQQTGERYPTASDDGPSYYRQAVQMAERPSRFFTSELNDQLFFTGYYPLMALWFKAVGGPHIPSWLLWHGLAGGLLVVSLFWLGQRLAGTAVGALAAVLGLADHVMLHLMATMNMETFFIPTLYLALLLWVRAAEPPLTRQRRFSWWAGVMLGLATVFRPTSLLLPAALVIVLWWERPRPSWRETRTQVGWLLGGFALPLGLLYLRNRIAWGAWTLASSKAEVALQVNDAFDIHGQHLAAIGLGPWLRLLLQDPSVIWTSIIPRWWDHGLRLWTHPGFGQMDVVRGLNHAGPYQALLAGTLLIGVVIGLAVALRRRSRADLVLLVLPAYFTSLILPFLVLNSRYRSPFIPALYALCCLGFSAATAWPARHPSGSQASRSAAYWSQRSVHADCGIAKG